MGSCASKPEEAPEIFIGAWEHSDGSSNRKLIINRTGKIQYIETSPGTKVEINGLGMAGWHDRDCVIKGFVCCISRQFHLEWVSADNIKVDNLLYNRKR